MGWNSWDCFATTVTEEQVKANARVMAESLAHLGWQYIVVDIQWYEPGATGFAYRSETEAAMDGWGRLLPALNRFPSARDGVGFRPLAEFVHGLGLKFGVHLLRGIHRRAVHADLPVLGTTVRAADIADRTSTCPWNPDMYGVDMRKPGAQAYYDSVFALLAGWGVDYVKIDDISRPYHAHEAEIEAIRRAIDAAGRPIVLSLSPGATALSAADHVMRHANLWRISDDFWDNWHLVREQFDLLAAWNEHRGSGHWPDADMLPFGVLDLGRRRSRLTPDEQRTVMTLWSIARSPLMHGGDMTKMDDFTLSMLTNPEVLAVNQESSANRPLYERDDRFAWIAEAPGGDRIVALFNARDRLPLAESDAAFAVEHVAGDAPTTTEVDVDLDGAERLFLVVDDGHGRNGGHLFAVWGEPRLVREGGLEIPLSDLEWTTATSRWSEVHRDRAPDGARLASGGTVFERALGVHTKSVIEYALPSGVRRFRAAVGLASGSASPARAVARFLVFAVRVGAGDPAAGTAVGVTASELGLGGPLQVRDLWARRDLGEFRDAFSVELPWHGAGLFRVRAS